MIQSPFEANGGASKKLHTMTELMHPKAYEHSCHSVTEPRITRPGYTFDVQLHRLYICIVEANEPVAVACTSTVQMRMGITMVGLTVSNHMMTIQMLYSCCTGHFKDIRITIIKISYVWPIHMYCG